MTDDLEELEHVIAAMHPPTRLALIGWINTRWCDGCGGKLDWQCKCPDCDLPEEVKP